MLYIDFDAKKPIYQQLYESLTNQIISGLLQVGTRLPATRQLAAELRISRNTVNRVYQQLISEGYAISRQSSGIYVNQFDGGLHRKQNQISCQAPADTPEPKYDFYYGTSNESVFLYNEWEKSISDALALLRARPIRNYPRRQGELFLLKAIAQYLYQDRGVQCTPEQILLTCGHAQSMEILATLMRPRCDSFGMENPGYDVTREIFARNRFRIVPIPVKADGIALEAVTNGDCRLLYLTPSHQFPTGAILSVAKRQQLLDWAAKADAYLIEDDYDSELRYDCRPLPSLQSLDQHNKVIYTGTFSKSVSPTLRVGYLVLPPELLHAYEERYGLYQVQVSVLIQYALAIFIRNGSFEKQIRCLRTYYHNQRDALIRAINEAFHDRALIYGADTGMHILLELQDAADTDTLLASAQKIGIRLYPTQNFYADGRCPKKTLFLLGFGTVPREKMDEIFAALEKQWRADGCI